MALEEEIVRIKNNFESVSSDEFIKILNKIMPEFRNKLTAEYLQGKIQKILALDVESKKKKQCKALMPYFDWYLDGL